MAPGWFFTLGILYLVLLFTCAITTFRKGHWIVGLAGIVFPFLWLLGFFLPDRRRYRR
jgi:hypothetical protein